MDNSHSKEIALGRTTVKIPGGRPRGSEVPRTVPPTANGQHTNSEASSTGKCALNLLRWIFLHLKDTFFFQTKNHSQTVFGVHSSIHELCD